MLTTLDIINKKVEKEKITVMTAYDYYSSQLVDEAGFDIILVGDSLGMVCLGYDSTLEVSMEDMIHHGRAVNRGRKNSFLVVDMPFMSYNVDVRDTLNNAGRLIKEIILSRVFNKQFGKTIIWTHPKTIVFKGDFSRNISIFF